MLVGTAAPSANSVFISRLTPISASLGDSVTIQGGNFGANQGSSAVSLNGVAISPQSWSDAAIGVVVPASATSGPFVVTVNGTSVTSPTLTVRSIPSGWSDSDIGTVGLAGTAAYSNGAFSVQGSGSDINGTADSFHFLYQPLIGDGTIVARLASFQGSGAYQKAGVMIRETLAAGSSNVFVAKQGTGSSLIFDYRTATGGSTSQSSATASLPYWVKLVRSGNSFSGYTSSDGVNWTQVGSTQSISMAQSVYIGLAVVSNNNSALATASFDGTSINSNANAAPSISNVSLS